MSDDAIDTFEELAGRDHAVPLSEINPAPVEVSERLWSLGPGLFIQGDDAAAVAVLWAATEGCARVVVGGDPPPDGLQAGDAGRRNCPHYSPSSSATTMDMSPTARSSMRFAGWVIRPWSQPSTADPTNSSRCVPSRVAAP